MNGVDTLDRDCRRLRWMALAAEAGVMALIVVVFVTMGMAAGASLLVGLAAGYGLGAGDVMRERVEALRQERG